MQFAKQLRERIRRGEITCSVRIWTHPHVKPGGRYRMGDGHVEVDSIESIELADVTPQLARESGFAGVAPLLKIAKHGRGSNVYLVRFHYVPPGSARATGRTARSRSATSQPRRKPASAGTQRKRIERMIARLPGASASARGTHLSLEVGKRRFGYFLDDHHGDGRIALHCKSSPDVRDMLEQTAADQFHVPRYLGNKGWIGLWLDTARVDWTAVELALREAYALVRTRPHRRTL